MLMPPTPPAYVGRFAPSPTGDLHFGSLIAAVASFIDARAHGGRWLLRIEDVDRPRCVAGAAAGIQRSLERLGLLWDGEVLQQSNRDANYRVALDRLRGDGWVFACACSRKEIADSQLQAGTESVYPGTCRGGVAEGRVARAWRLAVGDAIVSFDDRLFGPQRQALARDCGDFVLLRADGLFAYQLAVVVDDAEQAVTDVVRGADLLDSTARQIFLMSCLGLTRPRYLHVPVAVDAGGRKLSKQFADRPLEAWPATDLLAAALSFLQHPPPADLRGAPSGEILAWAIAHWQPLAIAPQRTRPAAPFLAGAAA
jgi:glutamyl-Q tRNA(Asp) synthetase